MNKNKRLLLRPVGRCIGLDVHLDFIQIAICEEGKVYSAGRVPSTPEGLRWTRVSRGPVEMVVLVLVLIMVVGGRAGRRVRAQRRLSL